MTRFALRGLLGRKLRTVLTALAIVLGVAMVSGTYVLTDSIQSAFDSIFGETYRNTDAAITGKAAFDLNNDNNTGTPPSFNQALLGRVRQLPDVRAAIGGVADDAHLIGKDGKAIVYGGAPNLGFSVDPSQPEFNSLTLVDGKWPHANEVVIDRSTAHKEHLEVGDTVGVQARGPAERLRISGLVKFGAVSTIGGATLAGFDLPTAQHLFDKQGKLDQIRISAKKGVSPDRLVAAVRKILPPHTQVRTGSAQASKDSEDTTSFISFLQKFLLAFGGVALFVGTFVIANSLSITIAQRTREFATLRTLGASRRQVLVAVVVEAIVMGTLASLIGLFLGLALAKGLFKLFDVVGFTLPNSGLIFATRTIVVALIVGIVVTVLASLRPAFRATRVPPIAAVREGATLPPSRFARFRAVAAILIAAAGFAFLLVGLFASGLGTTRVLVFMLVGALLVFCGVALFSSHLIRPLASAANPVSRWAVFVLALVTWPITALLVLISTGLRRLVGRARPLELPRVVADRAATQLGSENSQRNPQRTASTAAALMIGLALVTLVATLAAGIIKPFEDAVDKIFTSDYAITAQNNFDPIPPSAARAAAKTPGLVAIASVRGGEGRAFGKTIQVTAVEPATPKVMTLDWKTGDQHVLATLGRDGAVVDDGYAKHHHLTLGSPVSLLTPTGQELSLHVRGIFKPPTGGSPFGSVTMSSALFDRTYNEPKNLYTFVSMRGGVTDANTEALQAALKPFPNAKAVTRQKFKDDQISGLKSVLNILYVLLALSVVVSLFGIINTLVLTVFERTRELGMLRAIGLTRVQTRWMIRHESVITALIGAVLGIVLGVVLATLLIIRIDFISFALPVGQLVIFAIAAVVVGILAAVFPARRAARLNPLEALHYE